MSSFNQFGSSYLVDLNWVLSELVNDQWIDREMSNQAAMAPRGKEQRHPLQIVADAKLKQLTLPASDITIELLSDWLAKKAGLPMYYIDPLKIDVAAATSVMSYQYAQRHHILAVEVSEDEVLIASAQPFYTDWEQGLKQVIRNKTFKRVFASPEDIHRYSIEFYNLSKSIQGASGNRESSSKLANFEQLLELKDIKTADANDQHIVNIVDWLLQYAFDQRASDIHMEPRREKGRIRFRIDGVLHDVYDMPVVVLSAVTSRIKILGRMNVAEKRKPQDGRLKTKVPSGGEVELRLSTLPTAFGEKMVMRIFDPDVLVRSYTELGLTKDDYIFWQEMVKKPNGIVLVTGPTGSGKTTTLYSTLKDLATSDVNVCTIEDPIEMVESAFNQMQVQASMDLTFSAGLKALLRQDPDIIMIGEIRDLETAEMAVQAALTGHLVITTLHTNDAASAVTRLVDLGVAPYLISATLNGIMAQRLVRTLCPHCKVQKELEEDVWSMLTAPWKAKKPSNSYHPKGCLECRETGYLGRMGIYEIMRTTHPVKECIGRGGSLEELRQLIYKQGTRNLRLSGARKVGAGITSAEEVFRVTPAISL